MLWSIISENFDFTQFLRKNSDSKIVFLFIPSK